MKVFLSLTILFTLGVFASAEIGSDVGSLLKIVWNLCYVPGEHSDPIAQQFIDCYDLVPNEKAAFIACQEKLFGAPLDTKVHIDVSCKKPYLLPIYAKCVKDTIPADVFDSALTIINKCQGAIFGLA